MSTYRKRSFVFWTCVASPCIAVLQGQWVPYAMAAKTFWPAPLGLAQLSDLVLEGTSFLIKKQGTTVKRSDAYFMLLFFFLTVGFSFIGSFWIPCDFFQLYWFRLFSCVFHTPSNCIEHMVRKACKLASIYCVLGGLKFSLLRSTFQWISKA